jgi:Na+/H+ antiporter NhaC
VTWLSIIPPVLAIGLALATRQVLIALLVGILSGIVILEGNLATAFLRLGDEYLIQALANPDHVSIVMFSTILGGMVGILSRSGATAGMVHSLSRLVKGRRGGQVATAAMGTVIFFDDYANTLLVGSTMRPLTDRLKISREKLAWLVDSTAAPVASVAVISTWVGYEVGLIQKAMDHFGEGQQAYTFFLQSIPYSYYPILTLFMVYMVASSGRDYGPMLKAERRAWELGQVLRPGAQPASNIGHDQELNQSKGDLPVPGNPLLGASPIIAVILVTALGLYFGGRQAAQANGIDAPTLRDVLNNANSYQVLMWASLVGAIVAVLESVATRRLSLQQSIEGYLDGARAMVIAVTILVLAWTLSDVCENLGTADFLVDLAKGGLSARLLPMVVFLLAGAVSFATGTSWGTMAILMPLVFPLGHELPLAAGLSSAVANHIHLAATSAVLAGAVFGDHCSPISDTTVMSSLACGSDHVDHVRTQLPYALTVGLVAGLIGYIPVGFGLSPWISLVLGILIIVFLVYKVGQPVVVPEGK